MYLIVDGDGLQPVQKQQEGGMNVVEQVSGLTALRAQRKADLCGPAEERTKVQSKPSHQPFNSQAHFPAIMIHCL